MSLQGTFNTSVHALNAQAQNLSNIASGSFDEYGNSRSKGPDCNGTSNAAGRGSWASRLQGWPDTPQALCRSIFPGRGPHLEGWQKAGVGAAAEV